MRSFQFFTLCLSVVLLICPSSSFAQNGQRLHLLGNVLRHVYDNNPTLKAARIELEETKELYPQARAGWLPTLSAETGIFATDIENSNFGGGDGATTKDLTLSLDQPIWRGGRTFSEAARARDLIRAGKASLLQTEQQIFLEVTAAYMNVIRDRELLDLRSNNEDILRKEWHAAQERLEIGAITNTDVQQAKARLARSKSNRLNAEKNLRISNAEFVELTGISPSEHMRVPYVDFNFPQNLDEMVALAYQQNPELWVASYESKAATHKADATFRELLPQVSAYASHNKQYDPQPGIVDKAQTQTVGLRATLALYEGGGTRSRIREARLAEKRNKLEIDEIKQRIQQEVVTNWRSYLAAQEETEIRKEEIEAAELALKGVRAEASLGQRTVLDILEADDDVIDAKLTLANARRNEVVTQFSLAASLGMLTLHQAGLIKQSK